MYEYLCIFGGLIICIVMSQPAVASRDPRGLTWQLAAARSVVGWCRGRRGIVVQVAGQYIGRGADVEYKCQPLK